MKIAVQTCNEIDRLLAAHYGFTDEELDFPSSKLRAGPSTKLSAGSDDIKCRMGRDAENAHPSLNDRE